MLEQHDDLVMVTNAVNGVKPMAFDPVKAEIASNVANAALDCCIEQYEYVIRNRVTIGLYEDSIRKAVSITDAMVTEIKDNVEQGNLLQKLHEYKAKKASRKIKSKQAS